VSNRRAFAPALALLLIPGGCGYHVAGRADLLPRSVQTIAIQPWANNTAQHRLAERVPAAVTREFIRRTRYQVIHDATQADAILTGGVVNIYSYPTTFDPATGRASGVQMIAILQAKLTERATGKVLFERPSMEIRQRYEISVDQRAFFDESSPALDRAAGDVARALVSAILENF
jgi:outer membrane lipopolysaccharide assembly protein LptE/RlpB